MTKGEELSMFKGCAIGVVFGSLIWMMIIAYVVSAS